MAKELPYFKFFVSEWNDGDITLEDFETQGLFINLCAYYWSNECEITLTKSKKKFRLCDESCFTNLIDADIIKVDNDIIIINFLDEQKDERALESKVKSKGGKASAEARRLKKLTESQQKPNTSSTGVQQVLDSSSTEVQLLREEERREEKKRKEEIIKQSESVYDLYPTKCPINSNSTGKSKTNKDKIKTLLKDHSEEHLKYTINRYKDECIRDKRYMKNFATFLNNLPDYEKEVDPHALDEKYVYFQWKNDATIMARRVLKTDAKKYFEGQLMGGLVHVILKGIKNKNKTWTN